MQGAQKGGQQCPVEEAEVEAFALCSGSQVAPLGRLATEVAPDGAFGWASTCVDAKITQVGGIPAEAGRPGHQDCEKAG